MFSWMKFQSSLFGKLLFIATVLVLSAITFLGVMFVILPTTSAQGPLPSSQISPQADFLWAIHLYASPTAPKGEGLWAFTGKTADICEKVTFNAEFLGVPTPFDGVYDPVKDIYVGFLDSFFAPGTGIQVGSLTVVCELANGNRLITNPIIFWRYHFDGTDTEIVSEDGRAKLVLNSNSLSSPCYIIVMSTNALPGPLPIGVTPIGLPYSFRSFVTKPDSDGPMLLNLLYLGLLGDEDPLTLRILAWDVVNNTWLDTGDQGLSVLVDPQVNKTTTQFTTYILGSTPRWRDSFVTNAGIDTKENISHIPAAGKVKLSSSAITGTLISIPYTPTMQVQSWQTVSYTAEITPGTSMTISVLSQAGEVLMADVEADQSLSSINPTAYPSLRLRVDMSTTATGTSPELLEWSILAEPDIKTVYLPIVLKG